MKVLKHRTDTYVLSDLRIDSVTVYATNYGPGQGKLVIECFGEAWARYWGAMGEGVSLQQFIVKAGLEYLVTKLARQTYRTDFDKVNKDAAAAGLGPLGVSSDTEIAFAARQMERVYGSDWPLHLPRCKTSEFEHLEEILTYVKEAFKPYET